VTILLVDWQRNRGSVQIQVALVLLRLGQMLRSKTSIFSRIASVPVIVAYRVLSLNLIGFDIPTSTRIGPGLAIKHGVGLVVNNKADIGENVTLRQCTTIGSKTDGGAPRIESNADIGSNCVVIGSIIVGTGAVVGAGSVVLKDVAAGDVVAGNPAKSLKRTDAVPAEEVLEE